MNDKRYEDADHHFVNSVEIHYAQDRDSNKHSLNAFFSDTGNTHTLTELEKEQRQRDIQTDRAGESEAKSETVRARDKKNDRTREKE